MWEDLVVEDKFIGVSVAKGLQSNRIDAVMFTNRQIHIDVESLNRRHLRVLVNPSIHKLCSDFHNRIRTW